MTQENGFRVLDGAGDTVETHTTSRGAARASLVLSAHEVLNGRVGDYRCDPPHFFRWDELDLPEWALRSLGLTGDGT